MIDGLANWIIRHRWWVLLGIALLSGLLSSQIKNIQVDNSNEATFIENDPAQLNFEEFKADFGNDDFVYILIANDSNILNTQDLTRIQQLADLLEQKTPYLKKLTWVGSVEHIRSVTDGIEISDLMPTIPEDDIGLTLLQEKIKQSPVLMNNLISTDFKTAALLLEFYPYPEDKVDARKESTPIIKDILASFDDLTTYAVGGPIIDYEYDRISGEEGSKLGLASLLIIMSLLLVTLRHLAGVAIPLLVILVSLLWTLGFIGLTGIPISMMIIMLPILLICVGVGDTLHFLTEFQRQKKSGTPRKEAIISTLKLITIPCLLTTLTTVAGFLAFQATAIQSLRDMGLFAAVGIVIALLLSLILAPILISFGKTDFVSKPARIEEDNVDRILQFVGHIATTYPRYIIISFSLLGLASLAGYSRVQVETNTIQALSEEVPLRKAYEHVDQHMGGSMALEIVLDSGEVDGIKEPAFLQQLQQLQYFIEQQPLTWKSYSILDPLKQTRRALNNDAAEFYQLPPTREQISQYLFLYETGGGEQLSNYVSFQYDKARINVRTKSLSTGDVREFIATIDAYVEQHISQNIEVSYTGTMSWVKAVSDHVTSGQKSSFLWAFLAISLIMILVLKSVKLGLISMIPNVFPVLVGLGVMGYSGIYMHMVLVIFAPIIIAVSVDDTIHFLFRFKREFHQHRNYKKAINQTLVSVGRPLLFTTLILVLGFSVFDFSVMDNFRDFGILAAIAFCWALLSDFLLVPALLILFKPLGAEEQQGATNIGLSPLSQN